MKSVAKAYLSWMAGQGKECLCLNKTPINTSLYETIVMHETCSTYDNSLPDMNVIWSKSIWFKALGGKLIPSHELISPQNLLAVVEAFFTTRTCHCTDLMKFILLSTLADNYKLNLPSSYIRSCFLPDWRALKQNFTLSALFVRLRTGARVLLRGNITTVCFHPCS